MDIAATDDFADMRPYDDAQVERVLAGLVANGDFVDAIAAWQTPRLHRLVPALARWVVRRKLRKHTRGVDSVYSFQSQLKLYFDELIAKTTEGVTWSGLDSLNADKAYLFVSNHRDIALDSAFVNYALWNAGLPTCQIAVGDNLISESFPTELMRLNKSFFVPRAEGTSKAQYAALTRISAYLRDVRRRGESVWIAQRDGRAKDGLDKTDRALLKMFALAYQGEFDSLLDLVGRIQIVPVSIAYELDPCAPLKAAELAQVAATGSYDKKPDEDQNSMLTGITGFKGRVAVHFGASVDATGVDAAGDVAQQLATRIDRAIVGNMTTFQTNASACDQLAAMGCSVCAEQIDTTGSSPSSAKVMELFRDQVAGCSAAQRPFVLAQYANVLRNRAELFASESEGPA